MVMPGERAEMLDFQEKASSNTKMSIDFNIPNANIVLPNKEFFEIIYNRQVFDVNKINGLLGATLCVFGYYCISQ